MNVSPETQKLIDKLNRPVMTRLDDTSEMKTHNTKFPKRRNSCLTEYKETSRASKTISKIFSKVFQYLTVFWSVVGITNIYAAYQIYKYCKASGFHGIIETKWSLFVAAYIVIMLALKKIHYALFKYANT